METILYTWKFSAKKERSKLWYIIGLSIVIGLVIWGFLTSQYGMSFIIILIAGISYFLEINGEDEILVQVEQLGIKIGEGFYDYGKIQSFTFIYDEANAILLRLKTNKKGVAVIDIDVDNTIAQQLRPILASFLQEDEKEDISFIDRLVKILKL
ncbi:hypothetical protein HGA92_05885 [Candidatus Gracilibacteria bacterium]|nr:hypothetical protein [Candidatus Gracilibacteria bacterium]NUJ98608.1 hypothetical protein [Candidatus Gracilibacteria bacterium]